MEETLQAMSQKLTPLTTQKHNDSTCQCFSCGKPGHLATNCRSYPAHVSAVRGYKEVKWSKNTIAKKTPMGHVSCPARSTHRQWQMLTQWNTFYTYTTSLCYTSCTHYWKS